MSKCICRLLLALLLFALISLIALPSYAANNGLVGVEISGLGDGSRDRIFTNLAMTMRPWTSPSNSPVTVDSNGWPTCDAQTVLFDIRPFGAWSPPADDPAAFQPDWSGVYSGSFTGQADLTLLNSGAAQILDKNYDLAINTTSFKIDFPKNGGLLVLSLTHTRRNPSDSPGTGFTHLRIIRPGYPADTKQIFTQSFLASLAPFSTLRMMDLLDTNENPGYYGDTGHHVLEWNRRHVPSDASQMDTNGKYGLAWEYIVDLANTTGKDIWINIPVAASDDYIHHLAIFLKESLKPGIKIYIEHSNEVWNFGFPQYIYNKLAAIDEVKTGHSTINNDGSTDPEEWTHRRHAKRLMEISNVFRSIYGDKAMMSVIRPVFASWAISLDPHFKQPLDWLIKTYGPPNHYFYAMALGHYFKAEDTAKTGTVDQILAAMQHDSDNNSQQYYKPFIALAKSYNLVPMVYEGGSDTGGGDVTNVANRITAERDPRMADDIIHDMRDNWFELGGGLYMYFAHADSYSRYGCWGLTEDIVNTHTYKYDAIRKLVASPSR